MVPNIQRVSGAQLLVSVKAVSGVDAHTYVLMRTARNSTALGNRISKE